MCSHTSLWFPNTLQFPTTASHTLRFLCVSLLSCFNPTPPAVSSQQDHTKNYTLKRPVLNIPFISLSRLPVPIPDQYLTWICSCLLHHIRLSLCKQLRNEAVCSKLFVLLLIFNYFQILLFTLLHSPLTNNICAKLWWSYASTDTFMSREVTLEMSSWWATRHSNAFSNKNWANHKNQCSSEVDTVWPGVILSVVGEPVKPMSNHTPALSLSGLSQPAQIIYK